MGLLKKVGKILSKPFKTGSSAAKRASNQANMQAMQAQAERAALEEKTRKERQRAQKLAIRGLGGRRAAQQNAIGSEASPRYGSQTIG